MGCFHDDSAIERAVLGQLLRWHKIKLTHPGAPGLDAIDLRSLLYKTIVKWFNGVSARRISGWSVGFSIVLGKVYAKR